MDEYKQEKRDAGGRYQKGTLAGPGRPRGSVNNPKRVQYVQATYESVSIQEWKAIVAKAKRDALGVKIIASEGRSVVIDDPESTGINRSAARIFLRDAVIGKPAQYIHVENEGDALTEFESYSDAELRAIANAPDAGGGLSDAELVAVAHGLGGDASGGIATIDTAISNGDNAAGGNRAFDAVAIDAGAGAPDIGGTGAGA